MVGRILNLNNLLSLAKSAQSDLDECESNGEYDRGESWNKISQDCRAAWKVLYYEICRANTEYSVRFTLKTGDIHVAVGMMGSLMRTEIAYSETDDAGMCVNVHHILLRDIEALELIDRRMLDKP